MSEFPGCTPEMPPMEVPVHVRNLAVASCRLPIIIPPADDNIDSIVPQLVINKRPAAFMWHVERQYETHRKSESCKETGYFQSLSEQKCLSFLN